MEKPWPWPLGKGLVHPRESASELVIDSLYKYRVPAVCLGSVHVRPTPAGRVATPGYHVIDPFTGGDMGQWGPGAGDP